jgi:hypothetical protein
MSFWNVLFARMHFTIMAEWVGHCTKKPFAFLIKVWPHSWNLLQWPLRHLYVELTDYSFSFMHICLVN